MPTTSRAAVIQGFDELVEELGGDADTVAGRAGLDLSKLTRPDAQISTKVEMDVLELSASETECEHFGLLLGLRRDHNTYLGLLGNVLHLAPTLGAALRDVFNLMSLHSQISVWQLHSSEEVSYVNFALLEHAEVGGRQVQQLVITILWQFIRSITNSGWHPTMVCFTFSKPVDTRPYQTLFNVPIHFEADFCGVVFHTADLDIEMPAHDKALRKAVLLHACAEKDWVPRSFDDQVRVLIRKNLELRRVGIDTITQFLPFESRTLQRMLKRHGTSYRELLTSVRTDMAKDLLKYSDISVTRLAERLCYQNIASFTKAFKKGSGSTPRVWRQSIGKT